MVKTTVYLPEELDVRLEAEATSTGMSKAELIRRGIGMLLDRSQRPKQPHPLPAFDSGHQLTVDDMDRLVYEQVQERAARR
jgi:Arc/MetJ-type ribon-helix-helix transcriptional regulator